MQIPKSELKSVDNLGDVSIFVISHFIDPSAPHPVRDTGFSPYFSS